MTTTMTTTITTSDVTALLTSTSTLSQVGLKLYLEDFIFPGGGELLHSIIVEAATEAEGDRYPLDSISEQVFSHFDEYSLSEWVEHGTPEIEGQLISYYMTEGVDALEAVRRVIVSEAVSLVTSTLRTVAEEEFGQGVLD